MKSAYFMKKFKACIIITVLGVFCAVASSFGAEQKPPIISEIDFEFAKTLKEREGKVVEREEQLKEQEKVFAEVQKEVDEKLTTLFALQKEVKIQLEELNASKDAQFRNLIKVYSAMSSTKVAPLLDKMEDRVVVKILRAMNAESVAKIIPKLGQDKAVAVSKQLGVLNEINLN